MARFAQERRALSLMEHPNIANALDGGITATGQPFLVMELVNGYPLMKFCSDAQLSIQARLELFVQICHAVQHAHQKGIIHRDLKSANILVSWIDGRAVPKIIDFGISKVIQQDGETGFVSTQVGFFLGTLEYMSPEQTKFSGNNIDTRTDVYSLGVILYELLTGVRPISTTQVENSGLPEMVRIIQEQVPPKPSSRLRQLSLPSSIDALNQTEKRKLVSMLRGELDWVVMKCLEKDRERRYDSVSSLGRDIERFLANEVVEARPPSNLYLCRKFYSRHRKSVLALSCALFAVIGGIVGTTISFVHAKRAQEAESVAKVEAQKRLRESQIANEVLSSIFDQFYPSTPNNMDRPVNEIFAENLHRAVERINGQLTENPVELAKLQSKLGCALTNLGDYRHAQVVLEKALATLDQQEKTPQIQELIDFTTLCLGDCYFGQGNRELGIEMYERTLSSVRTNEGNDSQSSLKTMSILGQGYLHLQKPEIAISILEDTMKRQSKALGSDHPDLAVTMSDLSMAYNFLGNSEKSIELGERAIMMMKKYFLPSDPAILVAQNNLSTTYSKYGQADKSLPIILDVLDKLTTRYGPDNEGVLTATNNLAYVYMKQKKYSKAIPLLEEATVRFVRKLGKLNPKTQNAFANLGICYKNLGRLTEALPLLEEAYGNVKKYPELDFAGKHLHECYARLGMSTKAAALAKELDISPWKGLGFTFQESYSKFLRPQTGDKSQK